MKKVFGFIVVVFLITSCRNSADTPLFELMSSEHTGVTFANTIAETDTFNILRFEYIYNGGGVGVGDVNNDGLDDVYFTGNMLSGKLYLNKGNFKFEDITLPAGVTTSTWATGVSMVDINQDGWLDIYVCTVNPDEKKSNPNLLFLNNGPNAEGVPTFTESAKSMGLADQGYSTQAAFLDYDRDGDLDMYLLTNALEGYNRNNVRVVYTNGQGKSTDRLYRNDGPKGGKNPVFTNVSQEAGILKEGWGLGVAISDFNRDGWPDIYAANDFLSNDILWINNGDGTFTNQIASYLKHQSHNSMGIDVADINNDGLSDFMVLDMLPETNKRQKTMFPNINYDRYQLNLQMGYETQYIRNVMQLNNGNGKFSEVGQLSGIHATDWSWSTLFADFDNDGYKDIYVTNGYVKDITDLDYITYSKETSQFGSNDGILKKLIKKIREMDGIQLSNYIYHNNGDLTFTNKAQEWGAAQPSYSNGAAYADLDNDGDLDLVVNNLNGEAFIYQNHLELKKDDDGNRINHYLRIKLKGSTNNQNGLGSTIELRYAGKKQFHEHAVTRGYKSTVENKIHFGLGNISTVDTLYITWPDGKAQLLTNVKADQEITVDYQKAHKDLAPIVAPKPQPIFTQASADYNIHFKHKESEYVDFKMQPAIPHKFSKDGPGIAVGDVDGNGLEDFYIGNSAHNSGALFLQNSGGTFRQVPFEATAKNEEDLGSLFFDADNDGDQDLYVVSGSSEYGTESKYYQDRLYINEGKGKGGDPLFKLDTAALPSTVASGSCVSAADYDRDGDLDLFVGGRIVSIKYPLPAESYLLKNDHGKFTNATVNDAKGLNNIGLVTSALWSDFDNDGWVDLVVVGEWMPVSFYKNNQGKLVRWDADGGKLAANHKADDGAPAGGSDSEIRHSTGWWNSLTAGDFDNDGDIDYVAGNLGLNSKFKASVAEPVQVYAKDYDGNGTIDPVMSCYLLGEDGKHYLYPVHPRDLLTEQMVSTRRKFHFYADYGRATFKEMFNEEELKDVYKVKSENFRTSYIENKGKGIFTISPLPVQAQFAPVFGIISEDFNDDGNLDLLLTGNSYSPEVLSGMYDASLGVYLEGNGKGKFTYIVPARSGVQMDGDSKGLATLFTNNGDLLILSANNSDSLKAFTVSPSYKKAYSVLPTQTLDAYAIVTLKDGKKRRQEIYYGSTYLSQSSRSLKIPAHVQSVTIYNYSGVSRPLNLLVNNAVRGSKMLVQSTTK